MSNIAIYGGSFDPPTIAHAKIANIASKMFDEVWIICAQVHAFDKKSISFDQREYMCKTLETNKIKVVSNYQDPSTYALLNHLKSDFPEHNFTFIIGQDCANEFHKWKNSDLLQKEFPFLVFFREGYQVDPEAWYNHNHHRHINADIPNISSSQIREYMKNNELEKTKDYLNPRVFDYIVKNNLYSDYQLVADLMLKLGTKARTNAWKEEENA